MLTTASTGATMPVVRRLRLPNGLRVVVAPGPGTGVVAVAVHYAVGYRAEPPGRAGFAHLFEHLMFQGSANVERRGHFRHVQGCGGWSNAVTNRDHTCYHDIVPREALERVLFLEADRMRAPTFTQSDVERQVAVIGEEIDASVRGRPYGGLTGVVLPPVLFDAFANAHDGYGAVSELGTVTVQQCWEFFRAYYSPANAVLTVVGDLVPDEVEGLVRRHFGGITGAPAPDCLSVAEPPLAADRESGYRDPVAPLPATVVAYRLPAAPVIGRLAHAALAMLLAGGEGARLQARLLASGSATHVSAAASLTGAVLESHDPDAFVVTAIHGPDGSGAGGLSVLDALDEELARVAADPDDSALRRATAKLAVHHYRRLSDPREQVQMVGAYELIHARGELAWEVADLARSLRADDVAAAASLLASSHRVVLHVEPGRSGTQAPVLAGTAR